MPFVIEKNIPIPANQAGRPTTGLTQTLRSMQVGDSILVPCKKGTSRANIFTTAKNLGVCVVTRKVDDKNIRIWRVADRDSTDSAAVTLKVAA